MVRVKFRYLVVNILYPEPTTKNKPATALPDLVQFHSPTPDSLHPGLLIRMIRDGVDELYGDYGSGMVAAGLKINYWSPSTSTMIIRCPRSHYEMVWATLTHVTHLPKPLVMPVVLRVIRVTGTIRKAEEEVIWRSKKIVARAREWERNGTGQLPMLQSVEKAVEKEKRRESEVLAAVDDGDESDEMSE